MKSDSNSSDFRVTLLGTGTPRLHNDRYGPSTLVEVGGETLIFDAGRCALQRIFQANIPLVEANKLFLTHLHSDHTVGIPDLWLTPWIFGRWEVPFRVWGPIGTRRLMSKLEEAYEYDIHVRRDLDEKFPGQGVSTVVQEIEEGVVYENNGIQVTAFIVDHYPIEPSFGFRVDFNGRSAVISGDTRFCENLIKFSEEVDLLVHEVGAGPLDDPDRPESVQIILNHHTSPEEAAEVFKRAKPKLAAYTHFVTFSVDEEEIVRRTRQIYDGPLEMGEDLMSFDIGESIVVTKPQG